MFLIKSVETGSRSITNGDNINETTAPQLHPVYMAHTSEIPGRNHLSVKER
jgi:hypothetical protein